MKKRADGRYRGKLLVGVVDGKQIYKYVYGKTKKQVDEKLAQLRVELGKGADLTQPMKLGFWVDRWLQREGAKQNDSNWFAVCRVRALYWKERLGDSDVSKVSTADMEDVLLDLQRRNPRTGKPSSKKTLVEYKNLIQRIFAYIAQNRAITFDPSKFLSVDRNAPATRRTAVATAVVQKMLETEDEIRVPCLIMAYAGLRLGEVSALTWSDVDLQKNMITVNKSWDFKKKVLKDPKTAAGVRTVPIPPPLAAVLNQAPRTTLLVCGKTYTVGGWDYAIERYNKKLGADISAHRLRHTCATMYYEAGIDVLTAQKWLGHADPSTTIKIYTHLREEKKMLNIIHLQNYFGGENSKIIHHQNGRGSEGGQDTQKTVGI